jgi:hypothetical protein
VYDFADLNGQPYLVMKYIEGRTLKAQNERGGVTLDDIVRILPPVASAIDYAHKQGVLHRDIKPSNIIIAADGTPYVADFGLAKLAQLGESTLSADVLLGTPNYISPEQAQGRKDVDHRTDLYSLGVVLYELVVGRVPFSADTPFAVVHDHIYKPLPAPSRLNPDITPQVEAVLAKALAKNPADRYTSAGALVQAFLEAIRSSGMKSLDPNRARRAAEILEGGQVTDAAFAAAAPAAESGAHDQTAFDPFAPVIAGVQRAAPESDTYVMDVPPPPLPPKPQAPEKPKRGPVVSWDIDGKQGEFRWEDLKKNIRDSVPQLGGVLKDVGTQVASTNWGEIGKDIAETVEEMDESSKNSLFYADDDQGARKRAEHQINKRKEFFGHAVAYALVMPMMAIGNSVGIGFTDGDIPTFWPVVALAWGSGLLAHGIETYYETGARLARRTRSVQDALYARFGAEWRRADKNMRKEVRKVRKQVEKPFTDKREFLQHAAAYVLINLMMWFIYFDFGSNWNEIQTVPWPLFVMVGWGLGLFSDGMSKLRQNSREATIAREMARERELLGGSGKLKNDHVGLDDIERQMDGSVRLTPDGEFTDSMVSEMLESDRARSQRRR